MGGAWESQYRKLVADYNTVVTEHNRLRAAVAKLLSHPSVGKSDEPEALIFLKRADLDVLEEAYQKTCGYA